MNWKLIIGLSMFGLAMAFLTVSVVPSKIEPILWILIFIICAYLIAKNAPGKYFLHGFMVAIFNCIWITGAHIALSATYLANHQSEADQYKQMYDKTGLGVTQAMLIIGPMIGVISGIIIGLFAFIASKIVKKPVAQV